MGCGSSSANTAVIAASNSDLKVTGQISQISSPENQEKDKMTDTTKDWMNKLASAEKNNKEYLKTTENKDREKEKKASPTEEDMKEKINQTFEYAKRTWISLRDKALLVMPETGKTTALLRITAEITSRYLLRTEEFPLNVQDKLESDYYRLMVAEDVIPIFCDMVVHILKLGYENEDREIVVMNRPLANILEILTNFTDNEILRADIVADHPEFLICLAENLKKWTEPHLSGEGIGVQNSNDDIDSVTTILHNIAMQDKNINRMRNLGFVDLLKPFMNSPTEVIRLSAIATLADIVDEQQSEAIRADVGILIFIKNCLERVMKENSKRIYGWSPQELARTVRRIARNDENKRALVKQGILPPLVKLAESEEMEEQRETLGALWTLSFDVENQKIMILDNECKPVDTFIRLQHSPDKEVRKNCNGALWTMRERLAQSERYKDIGEKYTTLQQSPAHTATGHQQEVKSEGHIMISYQWSHQTTVKLIRDGLRANGLKVWMDIDDMEGSLLDAMAHAVQNADLVLICYSQKYKDSRQCRVEAEYAFQKKKKVIPLKMEQNYNPDGWLGFICDSKLFFDFGGKYSFESRLEGLVKEISSKLNKDVVDGVIIPESASTLSSAPVAMNHPVQHAYSTPPLPANSHVSMTPVELVKTWNDQDVAKWMAKHSLSAQQVKKMKGVKIAFLMLLKTESPDFFYKVLTDTLKITNLLTIAQFRFALDDTKL